MFQGLFIYAAYCRTCQKTYTDIDRGMEPSTMTCPSCGETLTWSRETPVPVNPPSHHGFGEDPDNWPSEWQ